MHVERDDKDKVAAVYYPREGPDAQFVISRHPTMQEDNAHRNNLERIEKEYLLEQSLAFYKAIYFRMERK
jgi:hypothetical protein